MLIDWINSELADKRVIVKDIQEDVYDGQILQMLIGEIFYVQIKIRRI
jgi:parvin